jgi:glutamate 5-kinase
MAVFLRYLIYTVKNMTQFNWQRAVIKVGSALVAPIVDAHPSADKDALLASGQRDDPHMYLRAISDFIAQSMAQGKEVILVSSGSIALARAQIKTGLQATIAEKQAMAALGQTKMMAGWAVLFKQAEVKPDAGGPNSGELASSVYVSNKNIDCAQILLTVDDLADRKRFVNIKNTIEQLLINGALPIVNENDTVAVEEIKVGDNDNLAAHTAIATQADCLIICTDVDGLYTANPRTDTSATLLSKIDNITPAVMALAGGAGTAIGTGGMVTKLQAAQKCTQSGIQTLLVNGTKASTFEQLKKGNCPGSWFAPALVRQRSRQDWLAHTSKVKGQMFVDAGANKALHASGASLLAVGVTHIQGSFSAGDSVEVVHNDQVVGKGLVNYASTELSRILGSNSNKISDILGYSAGEAVIHRDNLVLSERGHKP